jgi:hypothetical protein
MEVPLNGITSVPNFMKVYQTAQKLLVGDTQTGNLISLPSFLESRQKMHIVISNINESDFFF